VDVRIVAATIRDLQALVRAGRFREDLFYRLSVFPVSVPPLVQRKADIPQLVQLVVRKICLKENQPVKEVSPEFLQMVMDQSWPGNVRELENAVEYAITVAQERMRLEGADLQAYLRNFTGQGPGTTGGERTVALPSLESEISLDEHLDTVARELIAYAIARENGNVTRAAARLGLTRRRMALFMTRLGLNAPNSRGRPRAPSSGVRHGQG
jgi:transcriptional regulator with GAF, ATPase, and Fis domain